MNLPIAISAYTVTTALGAGLEANRHALQHSRSGLCAADFAGVDFETCLGAVDGLEEVGLPSALKDFDCRNTRLTELGLQQDGFLDYVALKIRQVGAERIGVFIGTSTSGIQQTELAYAEAKSAGADLPPWFDYRHTHDLFSPADYIVKRLGIKGPAQVVSTACSSSAKVFGVASRYLHAGLCDVAIVGGIDSLCQLTIYGFKALQLVSSQPCRPADAERDGINIGEGAGFALLEKSTSPSGLALLGFGESSDAWHMSSPHPDGDGAAHAMRQALSSAGLVAADIDYVSLHGTATPANDLAEDNAMMQVFGASTACSSTKGFTGHTLGAAGIVGAVFACLAVENNFAPCSLNTQNIDTAIRSNIILHTPLASASSINMVMSNAFGFGGSNASLIIGRPV